MNIIQLAREYFDENSHAYFSADHGIEGWRLPKTGFPLPDINVQRRLKFLDARSDKSIAVGTEVTRG